MRSNQNNPKEKAEAIFNKLKLEFSSLQSNPNTTVTMLKAFAEKITKILKNEQIIQKEITINNNLLYIQAATNSLIQELNGDFAYDSGITESDNGFFRKADEFFRTALYKYQKAIDLAESANQILLDDTKLFSNKKFDDLLESQLNAITSLKKPNVFEYEMMEIFLNEVNRLSTTKVEHYTKWLNQCLGKGIIARTAKETTNLREIEEEITLVNEPLIKTIIVSAVEEEETIILNSEPTKDEFSEDELLDLNKTPPTSPKNSALSKNSILSQKRNISSLESEEELELVSPPQKKKKF